MRDADLVGKHGQAWSNRIIPSAAWPATLGQWLVHAPGRHAFWEYWVASLIHLRPIPGDSRTVVKKYLAAEHELMVFALEPDKPMDPDGAEWHYMEPADLLYQFDGLEDARAVQLVEGYVKAIVEGGQSPDSDARRWWERTLGSVVSQFKCGRKKILWLPPSEAAASSKPPR